MGILAFLGKGLGSTIFVLCLAVLIMSITMTQVTSQETMKPVFTELIKGQMTQQMQQSPEQLTNTYNQLVQVCQVTDEETIEVPLAGIPGQDGATSFEINCPELIAGGPENINEMIAESLGVGVGNLFDQIYLKEWNCPGVEGYIDCLKNAKNEELPLLILSKRSNTFFQELQLYIILGMLIGVLIVVVSLRNIAKISKALGVSCIFVGIGYFFMGFSQRFIPPQVAEMAAPLTDVIFSSMSQNFLIVFIVGIVLTAGGVVLGIIQKKKVKKEKKPEEKPKEKKEEKEEKKN